MEQRILVVGEAWIGDLEEDDIGMPWRRRQGPLFLG